MPKCVLEIGNCTLDHTLLSSVLKRSFQADVVRAHGATDALAALRNQAFDLVLVNRILDRDGSDGLDLIQTLKSTPELAAIPVMMITNYAAHQDRAVAAGAERGFGKSDMHTAHTHEQLKRFLGG